VRNLLLGIDIGTYSSKAVVATTSGDVVASAVEEHGVSLPRPGWAEQDAVDIWWADTVRLCRRLLSDGSVAASDIAGVAVSAIGPCLLALDAANRPLRPGILYGIDTRASEEIELLERIIGRGTILERFGMDLTSQAVGPKILWLARHEPAVWARTRRVTTASSFLVFRLTGAHVIDHHTAAHFMPLYDAGRGAWSDEFAAGLVPLDALPTPRWSDELAGTIHAEAARETGLRAGTPVAVGTVDALSEALSVGLGTPGELMIMYGSTTFFILFTATPLTIPGMWSLPGALEGQHVVAGGMATTGALTRWFVDEFAREMAPAEAYRSLFDAAAGMPPGAGGLLVLPYFSGERTPINDPLARGVIAGLSLAHHRAHLFRAVLEGVAFGIRQNIEVLKAHGAPATRIVAVGGGTQGSTWPRIVSDVSGRAQELPSRTIGASYGDAFLAGLAAGAVDRSANTGWVARAVTIDPDPVVGPLYDTSYERFRALYESTRETVHQLARLD
jgi:xylulokinase